MQTVNETVRHNEPCDQLIYRTNTVLGFTETGLNDLFSLWDFASCCMYNLDHYKYHPMQLLLIYNLSYCYTFLSS
jgi:hypothetical protein